MTIFTYRVVNAFVNNDTKNEELKGNPAAVIVLASDESGSISKEEKQTVARKLGLSETAFVREDVKKGGGRKYFNIEWFSPTCQVGLCGHASLASAACLFRDVLAANGEKQSSEPIIFVYDDGKSELVLERCEITGAITMSFPASPPVPVADEEALRRIELVREAFGDSREALAASPVYENSIGDTFVYMEETSVPSVDEIYFDCKKKVDYEKLGKVGGRGVVITALSNPEKKELIDCDFVSRFFGPNIGIAEDPVTGSAHCGLAPFFRNILPSSMDGKFLRGYQKSARGGLVLCRIVADKVELRGFCSFDKIDTIEI